MMQLSREELKQSFHNDMILLYKRITKELKYKSPRLIDIINKHGGYEAAIKYLVTESNVQDFAVLWENERLDLSVESLIISERYRDLFEESIVKTCERKLKEYSYAPLKIEEPEEEVYYYEEEDVKEVPTTGVLGDIANNVAQPYQYCDYSVAIDVDMWGEILVNSQIVTPKNLDLLLRIYLIGDDVTPEDLCEEEGYMATYPYNEVITAMAKRIKSYLKVEVPVDNMGKPLWWHLVFVGGLKDNKCFEWSLRTSLRRAIKQLVEEGKISIQNINVKVKRTVTDRQEVVLKTETEEDTQIKDNRVSDDISEFDKLFESIMGTKKDNKAEINSEINKMPNESSVKVENTKDLELEMINRVNNEISEYKTLKQEDPDYILKPHTSFKEGNSNKSINEQIKDECIKYYGAICDVCGFDYGYTYGEKYEMEIDIHNIKGEKGEDGEEIVATTNPVEDIVPICRNCHHILHSPNNKLSIEELRNIVRV